MRIVGLPILDTCKKNHAYSRAQFNAWQKHVQHANWGTSQDVKREYRTADFLADNTVIFNIKGNSYRLVVKVNYQKKLVVILWAGTHADYSKESF